MYIVRVWKRRRRDTKAIEIDERENRGRETGSYGTRKGNSAGDEPSRHRGKLLLTRQNKQMTGKVKDSAEEGGRGI